MDIQASDNRGSVHKSNRDENLVINPVNKMEIVLNSS